MKVKFNCPMFHQGVNYEKGKVYEVTENELKAIDANDYEQVGEDEEATRVARAKSMTKGAPKAAENK